MRGAGAVVGLVLRLRLRTPTRDPRSASRSRLLSFAKSVPLSSAYATRRSCAARYRCQVEAIRSNVLGSTVESRPRDLTSPWTVSVISLPCKLLCMLARLHP